jgi:hypothetical protein
VIIVLLVVFGFVSIFFAIATFYFYKKSKLGEFALKEAMIKNEVFVASNQRVQTVENPMCTVYPISRHPPPAPARSLLTAVKQQAARESATNIQPQYLEADANQPAVYVHE